ncbi:uncharacterized protein LOC134813419 [Bolinopsis microptera]|uniref:uncharacterized protein LOC134813419 n=1 Tax=Bolinopsis microptera TaxID=2820187 RepID=UPI00307952EA
MKKVLYFIEFYQANHILFLFNITKENQPIEDPDTLYKEVLEYAEIFGPVCTLNLKIDKNQKPYYILKYFSHESCDDAISNLAVALNSSGIRCNLKPIKSGNGIHNNSPLLLHQCSNLLNNFVGFSNWSLVVAGRDVVVTPDITVSISVEINIPQFDITATGFGKYSCGEAQLSLKSKGTKLSVANKMAYARACSDAFSTLAVVILPSGKCYVAHIDTTENIHLDFEVNEVDETADLDMSEMLDLLLSQPGDD